MGYASLETQTLLVVKKAGKSRGTSEERKY
jgi:hypothetical protein